MMRKDEKRSRPFSQIFDRGTKRGQRTVLSEDPAQRLWQFRRRQQFGRDGCDPSSSTRIETFDFFTRMTMYVAVADMHDGVIRGVQPSDDTRRGTALKPVRKELRPARERSCAAIDH